MVEVITPRLTIRRATREETARIAELNKADKSTAYLNGLSNEDREIIFQDPEAVNQILSRLAATLGDGDARSYGAWIGSEMIGFVTLHNYTSPMPDLQIELAPAYQGKGYGYEFLSELINYLFHTEFSCFHYAVFPNNSASIALVEKIGGVLQEPESEAERLLFRTYLIKKK